MPRNVAALVAAPRRAIPKQSVLAADQAKVFLRHVAGDISGARWAVAMITGMGQGE